MAAKTRKEQVVEARSWVAGLKPKITNLKFDQTKGTLSFRLSIEPEPQVRQTARSGSYMPGPIRYNGWKRACANALKKALKAKGLDKLLPLQGWLKLTCKFFVSTNYRIRKADLTNYVKALEDMINGCSDDKDPKYSDSTDPVPVWDDDRFIARNGEGHGKYPYTSGGEGYTDVVIEVLKIDMSFPKKKACITGEVKCVKIRPRVHMYLWSVKGSLTHDSNRD